jgi:hypothetical protein
MMKKTYKGRERRKFFRINYTSPLALKVCKKKTIHKILEGYISNVSESGVLCKIKDKVHKNDILWLSFDRSTLAICTELEKRSLIYQGGVVGKVVRIEGRQGSSYNVGIQFITREEKNLTNIFPKIHFGETLPDDDEETQEEENTDQGEEQGEEQNEGKDE